MQMKAPRSIQHVTTMARALDAVAFGWMSYPTFIDIDGLDKRAGLAVQDEIISIIGNLVQKLGLPLRFLITG